MQRAVPVGVGAMAAILGLDLPQVSAIAGKAAADLGGGAVCQAANDNGGGQVVISGTKAAVERAMEAAKAAGAKRALPLPVSAPFHCALMQPAADAMAAALAKVELKAPKAPLVANVTATALTDPAAVRASLVAQVTGAVRWRECVLYMSGAGVDRFVEIGAGKVLSGLIRRIAEGAVVANVGAPADVETFIRTR
jgi:[acyl-carrier-protein] S-malonyltransferase